MNTTNTQTFLDLPTAAQLVIEVAYQGTKFCGFARQPGLLTVQGELERVLSILLRREVLTVCAGRTDAGVHARQQVVSTPINFLELKDIDLHRMKRGLEALLDSHIQPRSLLLAGPDFSARFSADRRCYIYRLCHGEHKPLVSREFVWHRPGSYDVVAMQEGVSHLVGEHDFTSFCKTISAQGKNTVRTIHYANVYPESFGCEPCISVLIEGNAFLHSMIRIIMGSLVEVGLGRKDPSWIREVLQAQDRRMAGQTAPPQGLMLDAVTYKPGSFYVKEHLLALYRAGKI